MPLLNHELGDVIHRGLAAIGVTPERVTRWIGRPCGCVARQEKLNRLSRWAKRLLGGKTEDAQRYLDEILQEEE